MGKLVMRTVLKEWNKSDYEAIIHKANTELLSQKAVIWAKKRYKH